MFAVPKLHMHTPTHICFWFSLKMGSCILVHFLMQTCIHSKYEFTLIQIILHFFIFIFLCSTFMLSFRCTRCSLCACADVPCWAIVTAQASWRPMLQLLPNPCCVPCLLSHCAIPGHRTMPTLQARSQHRGVWYHPGHTDSKKDLARTGWSRHANTCRHPPPQSQGTV